MSVSRSTLAFVFVGALTSCYYEETFYPDVVVRDRGKSRYEVQIRKHIEGRGNIHTFSLSKYEYDDSDWLYLSSITGTVEAKSLVFTNYWACVESPWNIEDLKGRVDFKDGKLTIALEAPSYEDGKTMSGYRPLDVNGTYTVRLETTPFTPTDLDINGAPCDRNWLTK